MPQEPMTDAYWRTEINKALNELGVPTPDYPAPVANAVDILMAALLNGEGAASQPQEDAVEALAALRGGNAFCARHKQFEAMVNIDGFHATPEQWDVLLTRAQPDEPSAVVLLREAAEKAGWWIVANAGPQNWWPESWKAERKELLDLLDAALADTAAAATEARQQIYQEGYEAGRETGAQHPHRDVCQQIEREAVERVLKVVESIPPAEPITLGDGEHGQTLTSPKRAAELARALLASAEGEKPRKRLNEIPNSQANVDRETGGAPFTPEVSAEGEKADRLGREIAAWEAAHPDNRGRF